MTSVNSQVLCPRDIWKWQTNAKLVNSDLNITFQGNGRLRKPCSFSTRTGRIGRLVVTPAARLATELTPDSVRTDCKRQDIPTKKQLVDPFRQGVITDGGVGYSQTVVVRSYEVGADKTMTLESLLNLLQETALNHVWVSGLLGDGFGATHGMVRNNLIWVVTRMHVQVDRYPIWGEVLQAHTWVGASGKNGMRRDWIIKSQASGQVFGRASSTWVMMNQQTRRLSKMPDEVRAELSPWYTDKRAIQDDVSEKINILDGSASYISSNLKPKRSDLDMNHHVNNVKYVNWMLEAIPCDLVKNHQLFGITLEYRKECGRSDVVQSLCDHEDKSCTERDEAGRGIPYQSSSPAAPEISQKFIHLLQITGKNRNEEIVRGRTMWRRKT